MATSVGVNSVNYSQLVQAVRVVGPTLIEAASSKTQSPVLYAPPLIDLEGMENDVIQLCNAAHNHFVTSTFLKWCHDMAKSF